MLITNFLTFINENTQNNIIDWNIINNIANSLINSDTDKSAYFEYLDNNIQADEANDNIQENILLKLYNNNIITKNITELEKILMCLYYLQNIDNIKSVIEKYETFEKWYKNGQLTVYRGIPLENWDESQETIKNHEFKSFSNLYNIALIFTQYGVNDINHPEIRNKYKRNGMILTLDVSIDKIHIFNNFGYEYEIVVKGELQCLSVQEIIKGEIVNERQFY